MMVTMRPLAKYLSRICLEWSYNYNINCFRFQIILNGEMGCWGLQMYLLTRLLNWQERRI